MRFTSTVAAASSLASAFAQVFEPYTDTATGIVLSQAALDTFAAGALQVGFALAPAGTGYDNEFIGRIAGTNFNGGYSGLSLGGGMPNNLLLTVWPSGSTVKSSFRFAGGYVAPDLYTGNATITPIRATASSSSFEILFRCQNCWSWDQGGAVGGQPPTDGGVQVLGWAASNTPPTTPSDANSPLDQHQLQGIFVPSTDALRNAAYSSWVKLASPTTPPSSTTSAAATTTAAPTPTGVPCDANNAPPTTLYDYIVVGAGAGGIPVAAKLAESGKSVLLIERGPPSSGRWGGTMKPAWLSGTNLTRFDVPGLCNRIWSDSAGIACSDVPTMSGCVLGGGTAVNAALWWKANPADFDYNFPAGWKAADMADSIDRVFKKIPGTDHPSRDGKLYYTQGYNAIGKALSAGGYQNISANQNPNMKHRTYSFSPYMFANGERGGPMATYLVEASNRRNFKLWTNTTVARVSRTGSKVTGVEVEAFGQGGFCGKVGLTATGRVILSAGTYGTSKILFRSGIGPTDALQVVQGSTLDKGKMIDQSQWINLPVGYNLDDHTNTDLVVYVPSSVYYDWPAAYDTPIPADKDAYLKSRTGILTQSAPNIGPIFWEEIKGADGITRQFQYTSRVEGSAGFNNSGYMTVSQYLGRGSVSRGRLSITPSLSLTISKLPYLQDQNDVAAVIQSIKNIRAIFAKSKDIQMVYPSANQTEEAFLAAYPITTGRSANHWIGTAKMGTDSGLTGGTAVVDTNTKVYGTDNLFVVDASIFPGMVSTNPSALIVAVAEQAATKILALPVSGASAASSTKAPAASAVALAKYAQCAGSGFSGAGTCASGMSCKAQNAYYSQCL